MIYLIKMRRGFSMITAIFVILLLSTVGGYIVNLAGKTVKTTTFQYRKEQSAILAKSYTELAIMGATANNANDTNCLESIKGTVGTNPDQGEGYSVEVKISYIGDDKLQCSPEHTLYKDIAISPNDLYIIVDVFVKYIDFDVVAMGTVTADTPRITYHRRTLQKL
jgi:type II secretory pathway pseudopilin PulG